MPAILRVLAKFRAAARLANAYLPQGAGHATGWALAADSLDLLSRPRRLLPMALSTGLQGITGKVALGRDGPLEVLPAGAPRAVPRRAAPGLAAPHDLMAAPWPGESDRAVARAPAHDHAPRSPRVPGLAGLGIPPPGRAGDLIHASI